MANFISREFEAQQARERQKGIQKEDVKDRKSVISGERKTGRGTRENPDEAAFSSVTPALDSASSGLQKHLSPAHICLECKPSLVAYWGPYPSVPPSIPLKKTVTPQRYITTDEDRIWAEYSTPEKPQ
ncbi:hypothetical protein NDU88_003721 [Pleurodeles waltl]|uniref:Uncharacterized protein n=1 Tax=Pleurodeles waltl TaxID=8319 RepID=A0AAV7LG23_PLEWA|nr:hypothetical protein NDU88_003721 [Pleurodeles waltl]